MKNYLPKILITGSNGQLGHALLASSFAREFQIMKCGRDELDITNLTAIQDALTEFSPDIIINAAAYTAVDKAESETEQAVLANHIGAENLALACEYQQISLIHVSTDYVFDGQKAAPYREQDAVNPINFYGESKWLGEQAVREQCEKHIILRVSGVFSEYGNNFLKTMLRLAKERKELNIVADQITCPTYAGHIANAIFSLIHSEPKWGTYHYCDKNPVSWHEFATAIIDAARQFMSLSVENINAITTAEYPLPAKRPPYSVLDCHKLEKEYGIKQSEWTSPLNKILRNLS